MENSCDPCAIKYPTRYWAVYVDGKLLAVTVYRKGARAIADMQMRMRGRKQAGDAAWKLLLEADVKAVERAGGQI